MGTVFVAGTEIGVGKTVVAAALARAAVESGSRPAFFKPFITDDMEDVHSVLAAAADQAGRRAGGAAAAPAVCTSEYAFNSHASPYIGMGGTEGGVDVSAVLDTIQELCDAAGSVIVEGSGSVMTPIRRNYFVADLMADASMSSVVVTTNRIGALSLAAMSAEACRERGAPPVGFVINCIDPDGYEPGRLAGDMSAVTGSHVLAVLDMHGERPAQGRKGSLFGSRPPQAGADGQAGAGSLPEGARRSAEASGAIHGGGRLAGIAAVLLAKEDYRAQALRKNAAEMRRRRLVPAWRRRGERAGAQGGGKGKRGPGSP